MNETRYPLCWPANWKRTQIRTNAQFGKNNSRYADGVKLHAGKSRLSIADSIERIAEELRQLRWFGVKEETIIISTNLPLNIYGAPRGDRGEPGDPGAAVYWTMKGKSQCMAIDRYSRVADNLAAIAATLDALRAIERHGGGSILDRAFIGFAALPAAKEVDWRELFVISPALPREKQIEQVKAAYRQLAADAHPDKIGGNHQAMAEINAARDAALKELGA